MPSITLTWAAVDQGDGTSSVKIYGNKAAAEIDDHLHQEHYGMGPLDIEEVTLEFNEAGEITGPAHTIKLAEDLLEELDPNSEEDQELVARLGLKMPGA